MFTPIPSGPEVSSTAPAGGEFYPAIFGPILGRRSHTTIAIDVLAAGAIAAGLCGKGPVVTAVTPKDNLDKVKAALQKYEGENLLTKPNSEKDKVG